MFVPEKMIHVQAVFPARDVGAVAESIIRNGVLQLADAADVEVWAQDLPKAGTGDEAQDMRSRRERVETVMKLLGLSPDMKKAEAATGDWERIDRRLSEIDEACQKETALRDDTRKELTRLEAMRVQAGELPSIGFPLEGGDAYSYLSVEMGRIAEKNLNILKSRLEPILHTFVALGSAKGNATILVVSLKRDKDRLHAALTEAGFESLSAEKAQWMMSPEKIQELDRKIEDFRKELSDSEDRLGRMAAEQNSFLHSVQFRIQWESLKHQILQYFRKTDQTYVLAGWLPQIKQQSFAEDLKKATSGRCVLREIRPEDVESVREGRVHVPVKLKNPYLVKPFELLISQYGTPDYRTIDPTPIFGISFLAMFGLMFGDVGHGFVLALAGIFLFLKSQQEGIKQAGLLVLYAGCSSMVFGFLFGSIFGFEEILPTLWLKPMESVDRMFSFVIYFGAGLITVSIVISMINKYRKRKFLHIVFDKAGVLGGVLYWCGIFIAASIVGSKNPPPIWILIVMAIAGILMFLSEPIMHALQRKKLFPEGVASAVMGGAIEILEVFLGYLANTVSFIRVAAFGLAHVGLFMAVFALSDSMKTVGHGTLSIAIQVVGNIGIIALEGLVVTIQCVRLEFYEFLSRFFEQGNVEYKPFGSELKNKVIG